MYIFGTCDEERNGQSEGVYEKKIKWHRLTERACDILFSVIDKVDGR